MKHRKSAKVDYPNLYASEDAVAKNPAAFVSLYGNWVNPRSDSELEIQLRSESSSEHCRECWTDPCFDPLPWYVSISMIADMISANPV